MDYARLFIETMKFHKKFLVVFGRFYRRFRHLMAIIVRKQV